MTNRYMHRFTWNYGKRNLNEMLVNVAKAAGCNVITITTADLEKKRKEQTLEYIEDDRVKQRFLNDKPMYIGWDLGEEVKDDCRLLILKELEKIV